jgi:hypothetical protein
MCQILFPNLIIFEDDWGEEMKRMTFIRTLCRPTHSVIRLVVNSDGTGTLVARLMANSQRKGEASPRGQTLSFSSEQVNEFLKSAARGGFLALSTAKSVRAFDGQEWLWRASGWLRHCWQSRQAKRVGA